MRGPLEASLARGLRMRYLGDPVLHTPAEPVATVEDLDPALLPTMRRELDRARGLGLAAQQVGSLQRVALMRFGDELVVAINLEILQRSEETAIHPHEGCLSIAGGGEVFRTNVRRHVWVRIRYLDEAGEEFERSLEGLPAIIAQHEHDHLEGRLIVDGLPRAQRRRAQRIVGGGS